MSAISTALIVGAITVWIVYATFRMAPSLEHRWKVWGQVAAYLIFAGVIVLIEVALSKF
jgi:multisubunit Na+/H+ antiporter MnhB subunit